MPQPGGDPAHPTFSTASSPRVRGPRSPDTAATTSFSVNADVDTGHWLDTPEPLGEVSLAEFDKLFDTSDATFTTFEINGETAAIIVRWQIAK